MHPLNWQRSIFSSRAARRARELLRQPAIYAAMLLFAFAALIFWRRLAGAIREPLPPAGFALAGVSLSLLAGVAHWSGKFFPAEKIVRWCAEIALLFSLLAAAAALTVPGASVPTLAAFWMLLLLEEGWARRARFFRIMKGLKERPSYRDGSLREGEAPAEPKSHRDHSPARREPRPPEIVKPPRDSVETILPEEVTQQFTRSTAADGAEVLAGWLRVPFAAGQRTHSVHLAFCPPFARTPALAVEQADGPAARIKTAQILPYGARLDLKLHAPPESPAAAILHFSARSEGKEAI
jgi:hypothetical protein